MASLHPASGSPVAVNPGVFSTPTLNPFLRVAPAAAPLRPANQNAPSAESLEVTVQWGSNVLAVTQLTPPRAYAVGEVGGAGGAGTSSLGNVDFAMEPARLGSARRELVTLRRTTRTSRRGWIRQPPPMSTLV